MRSQSHPLILAALLAAAATQSTLLSAFQANQAPAKDNASLDCTDAKEPCGLPGPDIKKLYGALAAAINKPDSGAHYLFPAELVAASYGWSELGSRIGSKRWFPTSWTLQKELTPAILKGFARNLAAAKRRVDNPQNAPFFVAVDLPELGARIYDAALVRSLVNTEMFPNRLRIVSRTVGLVKVPYIELEDDAASAAESCFTDISTEAGHQVTLPKSCQLENTSHLSQMGPSLPTSIIVNAFAGGPPKRPTSTDHSDLNKVLVTLPVDNEPISLALVEDSHALDQTEGARNLHRWGLGAPTTESNGCVFEFSVNFPQRTTHAYKEVYVLGEFRKPFSPHILCGPKNLNINVVKEMVLPACADRGPNFNWAFTRDILNATGPVPQSLLLFAEDPRGPDISQPELFIILRGEPWFSLAKDDEAHYCINCPATK